MDPDEVRRRWSERSRAYSPEYYAYYGPNETSERIGAALEGLVDTDASVLELGCSSGRHLAHLRERGFRDLSGVDVNDDAFDVMERAYPRLAATGTFHHGALENVVPTFDDGRFDAVYSVETLQHVHPDANWVFGELARVTDGVLVTAEIEPEGDRRRRAEDDPPATDVDGVPLYYRRWNRVFSDRGFVEVDSSELERLTLRTFESPNRRPDRS